MFSKKYEYNYNNQVIISQKNILKTLANKSRNELPFTLSIEILIDLLPYGKTKIYELLNNGTIPAKKINGKWIIPRDKFLAWFYGDLDNDDF